MHRSFRHEAPLRSFVTCPWHYKVLMYRFFGHEVATEGDSFTMAFHDPLEATAWCAATQQVSRPAALASSGPPCPSAVRFRKKFQILYRIVGDIFVL